MAASVHTSETQPMMDINTTPLIDVMLVLLIMLIITVPTQTDRVRLDLPQQHPLPPDWIEPLSNQLGMDRTGSLRWNDRPITDVQLSALLADVASRERPPEVHFRPDAAARYERVDQVLGIASRSGAKSFGFSGNERYAGSF